MSTPRNRARFERILAAFDELIELDEAQRARRLDELCADDHALRDELLAMLRADARAGAAVDAPLGDWAWHALESGGDAAPRQIGPWRILHLLGEGGMGSVYLAERSEGEFHQRAALKLLRRVAGAGSQGAHARFAQERQILADLQHEHIAQLIDGGVTEDGVPWYAMEYVDGLPITDWCREHRAGLAQRLRLMRQVASAVASAHRGLVVHRDLKPSNILVREDGTAKLLDFGIAKLLDPLAADETLTGQRMMTPRYAAPEQVLGRRVTTATDVYALGALLYELLGDSAPYSELSGRGLEDAILADAPRSLPLGVPADLRRIVEMAMRREPGARYPSVEALSEDLRRFERHEPVFARSGNWGYRLARYGRRHRAQLSMLSLVFLALVAGLLTTAWQADRARQEARRAQTISDFLVAIFSAGQSRGYADPNLSARALLDEGRRQLAARPDLEPRLSGELLLILGKLYRDLTQFALADSLLREAESMVEAAYGTDSPQMAQLRLTRSDLLLAIGDLDGVESILEEVHAYHLRHYGPVHAQTNLGLVLMANVANKRGDIERSIELYRQVLANSQQIGSDDADHSADLNNLGAALDVADRAAEADSILRLALELRRKVYGPRHPLTAVVLHNLASTTAALGNDSSAVALLEEAIDIRREVFPGGHVDLAGSLTSLAVIQMRHSDLPAAEKSLLEAAEMLRRLSPDPTFELGRTLNSLGTAAYRQGDYLRAAEYIEQAVEVLDQTIGPESPGALRSRNNRAVILHRAGELAQAATAFEDVLQRRLSALGPEHPDLAWSLKGLGMLELDRGNPAEAHAKLSEALRILLQAEPEETGVLAECWLGLGRAALAERRLAEADDWLQKARQGLAQAYSEGHPLRTECEQYLAELASLR